jgi:hypothetical protein
MSGKIYSAAYKACQTAITDGGLFTDTGLNKRGESE